MPFYLGGISVHLHCLWIGRGIYIWPKVEHFYRGRIPVMRQWNSPTLSRTYLGYELIYRRSYLKRSWPFPRLIYSSDLCHVNKCQDVLCRLFYSLDRLLVCIHTHTITHCSLSWLNVCWLDPAHFESSNTWRCYDETKQVRQPSMFTIIGYKARYWQHCCSLTL